MVRLPLFGLCLLFLLGAAACAVSPSPPVLPGPEPPPLQRSQLEQEAYEHNRAGMLNMSMARFEEAVEEFIQAVNLAQDYGIRGGFLVYTPTFMTAWTYEKMDRMEQACRHYRKFLRIAPSQWIEASKQDHSQQYLKQYC